MQVGFDLAKNVFPVHGIDERGQAALRKQLKRPQVIRFFTQLPPLCSAIIRGGCRSGR
jgi:transposase